MLTVILTGLALAFLAFLWFLGRLAARRFAFPRYKTEREALELCTGEFGDFDPEWFNRLPFEPFTVRSPREYDLTGVYLKGAGDKTIIMCHGHTFTWHGQVKYMAYFIERGWNIIAYNHRAHGTSGGPCCTAGFFEKMDLRVVADWAWETFPDTRFFGLQGESMGAATALQYMPLDHRLNFVLADCPYSDMTDLYRHQLKNRHRVPAFLLKPIIAFSRDYLKRKANFDMALVSPITSVNESSAPLLLCHGEEDTYVPAAMSRMMYEGRRDKAPTELVLFAGAKHGEDIKTDRDKYEKTINDFLERYCAIS